MPEKFKVKLRYYIPAARDQHVMQYDALIRDLKRLGFEPDVPWALHPDTDREDRSKNYLHGAIASGNALKLLDNPAVQTVQLVPLAPDEFKLPDGPDDPVSVRLQMAGNLSADRQRELGASEQTIYRHIDEVRRRVEEARPPQGSGDRRASKQTVRAKSRPVAGSRRSAVDPLTQR